MKRTPKLEVFPRRVSTRPNAQWYWHLKAANGKIICQGEGHPTKGKAIRAARRVADVFGQLTEQGTLKPASIPVNVVMK